MRKERPGKTILDTSMPPFFVEFQARRIAGDIGYVSFSTFLSPVDERFEQAIGDMLDMRGIIVGPSDGEVLPNGTTFQYLTAQSLTPDGIVLEGRGVIPDIIVRPDRESSAPWKRRAVRPGRRVH